MGSPLFLVRHGRTAWNQSGLAQGQCDTSLDPLGKEQSKRLGQWAKDRLLSIVLSSDLARAQETTTIAGLIDPVFTSLLRERSFGDWEGQCLSELHDWAEAEALRHNLPLERIAPPNGESLKDVWLRTQEFARGLRSDQGPTIVVSHGCTLSMLIAQLIGGGPAMSRSFRLENCAVTCLTKRSNGAWRLDSYNDSRHLEGL